MSPTVFKEKGYRFFFFSREEKRMHVHVLSSEGEAKFWLEPIIEIAKSYNFKEKQLNEIQTIIEGHFHELVRAWNQYFKN